MLRTLARTMLIGAVERRVGVSPAGPVSTALLTTGASLLLTRGRRPLGLGLAVAGGLLMWRAAEKARAADEAQVEDKA